jgi:hypothetical protein
MVQLPLHKFSRFFYSAYAFTVLKKIMKKPDLNRGKYLLGIRKVFPNIWNFLNKLVASLWFNYEVDTIKGSELRKQLRTELCGEVPQDEPEDLHQVSGTKKCKFLLFGKYRYRYGNKYCSISWTL